MDEGKVRRLREQAQHLIAVKESPSWPVVEEIVQKQIDKKTVLLCGANTLSDSALHHLRGHVHGMQYVLAVVDGGQEAFEKAVAAAQANEEGT